MFIAMDANFRLKNQLVSNYSQDLGLGIGWAYMLPREEYEGYVLSWVDDADVSNFPDFHAILWLTCHPDFDVRWSSSPCPGKYQIFEGFAVHWGQWDILWAVRDDLAHG